MMGLSSILLVLILIGFALPQEIKVTAEKKIKKSDEKLFQILTDFKSWEQWSPWADTSNHYTYFGEKEQKNAGFSWKSEKYGSGKVQMKAITPYKRIDMELSLVEGNASPFYVEFQPTNDSQSIVSWGVQMNVGFNPLARYFGFMFKRFISKDLTNGLDNLEKYTEKI